MNSCLVKHQARGLSYTLALVLILIAGLGCLGLVLTSDPSHAAQLEAPSDGDATAWFGYGLSLYEQKHYAEAREAFQKVLQMDPRHQKAFEWLSHTQAKLWSNPAVEATRSEESGVLVAQAEGLAAPTPDEERARQKRIEQLYDAANKLYRDGKYRDAQVKISQLLEIDPDNAEARQLSARVAEGMATEREEKATADQAKREAEARKKEIKDLLDDGKAAVRAQQWDEAAARYQAVLEIDAGNRDARSGLARVEEGRKQAEARAQQTAEAEARRVAAEEAKAQAAAERAAAEAEKRAAAQEAARQRAERVADEKAAADEARRQAQAAKAAAEEEKRAAAEAERARRAQEQEERRLAAEAAKADAAVQRAAADEEKRAAQELAARQKAEREAAEQLAREETRRQEAAAKARAEEERRLAAEKARQDEAATRVAAEEARRVARQAEEARKAAEEQQRRVAQAQVQAEVPSVPANPPALVVPPAQSAAPATTTPVAPLDVAPAPTQEDVARAVREYLERADRAVQFNNWRSAEMLYKEALALDPGNTRARRGLERAQTELAKETGDDARARAADLVLRAEAQMRDKNYEEAEALYQQALALDSGNREATAGLREASRRRTEAAKTELTAQQKMHAEKIKAELTLAETLRKKGEYGQAEEAYRRVLALEAGNRDAQRGLQQIESERQAAAQKAAAEVAKAAESAQAAAAKSADQLVDEGKAALDAGQLIQAVGKWQEAARMDPGNERARLFLSQYQDAADQAALIVQKQAADASAEAEYNRRLDMPAPDFAYNPPDGEEIKRILSDLSQVSGLNFVAAEGVEGRVVISLSDRTIRQVLDAILIPHGFSYERVGEVVYVSPNYKTRVFQLNDAQYDIIKRMLDNQAAFPDPQRTIQFLLYGDAATTPKGKKLQLHPLYHQLIVTDSEENIRKVERFLAELSPEFGEMALVSRSYYLDPTISKNLYKIVEIALYPQYGYIPGIDQEHQRMLLLKDDIPELHVLFVRDTLPNLEKVEEILQQQDLRRRLREGSLTLRSFQVTTEVPVDDEGRERVRQLTEFVYTMISYMLYGHTGLDAAQQEGRRMEYHRNDPTLGRIDVIDTPENLKRIEDYLNTVAEATGDTDQLRKYTIRIGNLWDVTDTVVKIIMATETTTRRIFINTQQLGQIARFGGLGGGRAQGVRFQSGQVRDFAAGQQREVSGLAGTDSDLDIYDALFYPDPLTHTLWVRSRDPILFERVQTLVTALDIPPKMVEIEARLVEVGLTELQSVGVDWSLTGIGRSGINWRDFESVDFTADALNQLAPQGVLFNFATLGETQLSAVLSLISSLNSAEVLSAPRLVTKSAPTDVPRINVTTIQPYIDEIQIDTQGDDDPTNNVVRPLFQQVEVGVVLNVYPIVTADNHVYLDVYPQISVVTDRLPVIVQPGQDVGGSPAVDQQFTGLGIPVIDSREVYNEVFLNNGETLVLGGFIRDELQTVENRVPLLHRIPLFGNLFKDTGQTKTKRTLLIFVTVNVLPTR